LAQRWLVEKASDPLDRRVYVSIVALASFGFGLWFVADSRQVEAYGAIIGGCAGMAAILLFGELFGVLKLRSPTLREVVITAQKVSLNAGHVQQLVKISDVIRIEVQTHRHIAPLLVLVTHDNLSCAIPRAGWDTLKIEQRLRKLKGVRWKEMSRAMGSVDERIFVLWRGSPGQAADFTAE